MFLYLYKNKVNFMWVVSEPNGKHFICDFIELKERLIELNSRELGKAVKTFA